MLKMKSTVRMRYETDSSDRESVGQRIKIRLQTRNRLKLPTRFDDFETCFITVADLEELPYLKKQSSLV